MADLINEYAGRGIMLPRTAFELAESIRDFVVAYEGPTLVGCGALHIYPRMPPRSVPSRWTPGRKNPELAA